MIPRKTLCFKFDLLPFIEKRREHEVERASRARSEKNKKIKKIEPRFPSVNKMYPINRRTAQKYLSDEGRLYKEYIGQILDKLQFTIPTWKFYYCTYVFFMTHEMMYTKKDEIAEHDVSNFLKGTEDALFDWLMESDSQVLDIHGSKRLTLGDPKLVILFSEAKEGDNIRHQDISIDPFSLENHEETFL